ncbi:hypothetical protein HUG17_9916 [Dermatophagoides farinae]|uniref:BTB domain-containing protein n=1 Tax=Dermatophagoides farinae TaxID=6954 RepID=A0A9D4SJB4_DERFA|nr:hypothetical protein HUG17_9916 [Dermatophagoides farinae]
MQSKLFNDHERKNDHHHHDDDENKKFLELLSPSCDGKSILENYDHDDDVDIEPPSINDVDILSSLPTKTIGLMKIDFDDYENQFKAIGQLRKHTETIDLILSTIDGGNEPVHQYFLALRAPKLWQRLIEYEQKQQQQKQNHQNHQSTIIDEVSTTTKLFTDDDRTSSSSSSNIKRLFVPKEFIDRSILLRILIDSIINLSNCIELWKIGLKFYPNPYGQQLAKCSYRFLLANLVELLHSSLYGDTIKSLTIGQLKTIIDDNRLNIRNEMEIWFLIRKWMIESNNSG